MIPRGQWLERAAVWTLTLALTCAGVRDLASYGRERRRQRLEDRAIVDFLQAEKVPDEFLNSRNLRLPNSRIMVEGLGGAEGETRSSRYRHGLGPVTRLTVVTESTGGELTFLYHNGVEGQDLTVRLNDEVLETLHGLPAGELRRSYPLKFRPGQSNAVSIEYGRYNHHGAMPAEHDPRPLAGTFFQLALRWQ